MKWEEAVQRSSVRVAYRYKVNARISIVNADRRAWSDLGHGLVEVDPKAIGKFDDWMPANVRLMKKHTGQLSDNLPATLGSKIIANLEEFENVSLTNIRPTNFTRDAAIKSLADLAYKFLDTDVPYARMVTAGLVNYLGE